MSKMITVEVAYATPANQKIIKIEVEEGSTIEFAIHHSGILKVFPEVNLASQKVGVFSKPRQLSDVVLSGDRIEIYRPLCIDPKEARRSKAKQIAKAARQRSEAKRQGRSF